MTKNIILSTLFLLFWCASFARNDVFYSQSTDTRIYHWQYSGYIRDKARLQLRLDNIRSELKKLSSPELVEICTDMNYKYLMKLVSPNSQVVLRNDLDVMLVSTDAEGHWMAALQELASRNFEGIQNPNKFILDFIGFIKKNEFVWQRTHVTLSESMIINEANKFQAEIRLKKENINDVSSQIQALLDWIGKGRQFTATKEDINYGIWAQFLLKEKILSDPEKARTILVKNQNKLKDANYYFNKIDTYLKEEQDVKKDIEVIKSRKEKGLQISDNPLTDDVRGP